MDKFAATQVDEAIVGGVAQTDFNDETSILQDKGTSHNNIITGCSPDIF